MASSIRGRAVRLLDNLISQTLVLSARNISRALSENTLRGDYPGCQSAVLLTTETRGRARGSCRRLSSGGRPLQLMQEPGRQTSPPTPEHPDPLVDTDLRPMFDDIKKDLEAQFDLQEIAKYYFDGQGKAVRPLITVLMSRAINTHLHDEDRLFNSQWQVAKVTEMLHTASLVHDDVLDASDTRRGKPSVSHLYGQRKAVMAGDYILSVASTILARIRNEEVIVVLSQVLTDLVQGEFMQLGSKENENERFAHYLKKTFKKTASLIAYSCKAVAILSGGDEDVQEMAFQYGRNVGIAFQLVDDLLDFVSSATTMGKPTAADLKLGLATAPVLWAYSLNGMECTFQLFPIIEQTQGILIALLAGINGLILLRIVEGGKDPCGGMLSKVSRNK